MTILFKKVIFYFGAWPKNKNQAVVASHSCTVAILLSSAK